MKILAIHSRKWNLKRNVALSISCTAREEVWNCILWEVINNPEQCNASTSNLWWTRTQPINRDDLPSLLLSLKVTFPRHESYLWFWRNTASMEYQDSDIGFCPLIQTHLTLQRCPHLLHIINGTFFKFCNMKYSNFEIFEIFEFWNAEPTRSIIYCITYKSVKSN